MLVRQINLVKGSKTDVSKATREEWRARSQRAKWSTRNPAMTAMIALYDNLLREEWGDRHCQIIEDTSTAPDHIKELKGLELLRWSHDLAPKNIRPISKEWTADYYVRGSFQILSIERQVGWHPDYVCLTEDNQ